MAGWKTNVPLPGFWVSYNRVVISCTFCSWYIFHWMPKGCTLGKQHLLCALSTEPGPALGCSNDPAAFPAPIQAGVWSSDRDGSDINAFCMLANNTELQWMGKVGKEVNL